jgi:hypothetical protein
MNPPLSLLARASLSALALGALPLACTLDENGSGNLLLCAPGKTEACYTGDLETRGKGICRDGARTCGADGKFGDCQGQMLPMEKEDCSTPEDEDCDGKTDDDPDCKCKPKTTATCDTGQQGICAAGIMTCSTDGTSWGLCVQSNQPRAEDCVSPLDEDCDGDAPPCTGATQAAVSVGGVMDDVAFATATNGKAYVVAGVLDGNVSFRTVNTGKLYVVKYDAALSKVWDLAVDTNGGRASVRAAALDKFGNVYLTGDFRGHLDVGGGMVVLDSKNASVDIFLLALGADGTPLWGKRFGEDGDQVAYGIALDDKGEIYLAGVLNGNTTFGGATHQAQGEDAFVAKVDKLGQFRWSKSFVVIGDYAPQRAYGIATTPDGDVVVAGEFDGKMDLGGGVIESAGGMDAFVARLRGDTGTGVWRARLGDSGNPQRIYAVAVGPSGEVGITGEFGGSMGLGNLGIGSLSTTDAFAAVLEKDGSPRWMKSFGDAVGYDQLGGGIAIDPAGNVVVAGSFNGSISFGGDTFQTSGVDVSGFLAKLAGSDGSHVWSTAFMDDQGLRAWGVSAGPDADVLVAGGYKGSVVLGMPPQQLSSTGGYEMFVARFAP